MGKKGATQEHARSLVGGCTYCPLIAELMNSPRIKKREIASLQWKPPEEDGFSDLTSAIDSGVCRVSFSPTGSDPTLSTATVSRAAISNARIVLVLRPGRVDLRRRMRELFRGGAIPRFRMRFDGAEAWTPPLPCWTLVRGTTPDFQRVAYKVLLCLEDLSPFFK